LTDIDGTISRITRHTSEATVSNTARRSLIGLAQQLDLVTVVTGRAVERARRMVGVETVGYVGNHGLEWLQEGVVQTEPAAEAARPILEAALAAVLAVVPRPELVIEDKRVSLAIHYRLSSDPPAIERKVLAAVRPFAEAGRLRLIEGALVANLLPGLRIDKGEATRRLVLRHGLRAVAFFGDDVTDLDAFRALHALRAEGIARTLAIGVGSVEGPPEVRAEADIMLEGVDEVERVLAALASRPPRGEAGDA
jgi:trehalose 6-phosphate phosphatase